jgi:hypothetical protein
MTDRDSDEMGKIMEDFGTQFNEPGETHKRAETSNSQEGLSKDELQKQFDGRYAASPAGNTQHLVDPENSQLLCGLDLVKNDWVQSDELGPFTPVCKMCKTSFATQVFTTGAGGSISELRDWFAERVDVASGEEKDGQSLTRAELQLIAKYIHSIESDKEHSE